MFKCYASEIRQAQKGNYPRIPLTCGKNRQIHKTESRLEVTRDFRKRKWNLLFMGKVSSELLKKIVEMDRGGDYTTLCVTEIKPHSL